MTTALVASGRQMPSEIPQRMEGGRNDRETISHSFKLSYKGKQRNKWGSGRRKHRDSRGHQDRATRAHLMLAEVHDAALSTAPPESLLTSPLLLDTLKAVKAL